MENELSRVVDALPGMVWTALPGGHVDFVNQRWCEYTGLGADEGYGQGWQAAIHQDDLPGLLERWRTILASAGSGEMEARLRRFDGEHRWFLIRVSPLTDGFGQIVKWCGVNTDVEDRNRAEAVLRMHERRFRSIVDGLPAVVTLMTPAGELEYANRHMLDYFGAPIGELKARATTQSFHPDDRPQVDARWKESVETGRPYNFEARLRRADGAYRWFHTRGFPLRDPEGHIVLWYLLQADVDDRKRAEALLAGEKRLLEVAARSHAIPEILEALCQLVESAASGCYCSVVLVDPSGTRLEHGVAPSLPPGFITSIVGQPVSVDSGPCAMAVHLNEQVIAADLESETRWAAHAWCQMALAHGLKACWSTPIASAAGKVLGAFALYYVEPRAPALFHRNLIEQFMHIASIAVERAQNHAALKRNEAFLAQAQRLSSIGSFSWRAANEEIRWSEEVYRIFEVDPGAPVTLELINSRLHPEDIQSFYEVRNRRKVDGRDYEQDYRLLMPDRSVKYLHVVAQATRDPNGQVEYIAAVQDVTQRRLSDEALGKARSDLAHVARISSLSALTASIAHEVNQPLSGIIVNASTCLHMLGANPPNIEGALETVRRTIRDGHRASDVIMRLRALFARKGTTTEAIDLNEAAREVIALSLNELQRSGMIVRREFADHLPFVVGDRVQLQQVILNLLLNAADAMRSVDDRPRQVLIKTEPDEDGRVRLTVRDVGVGFDAQGAERLFEAFYTTKSDGMGIGLSVSRSIVESHHGRLWAAPNDGPGATFAFSIPCRSEGAGVSRTPVAPDAGRGVRNA